MKKKVIILGAAGEIARMLTDRLVEDFDIDLVLYGRNVSERLKNKENSRITLVDGDFDNIDALLDELKDANYVYLNAMESKEHTQTIVSVLENYKNLRFIGASIAGIENEVPEKLSQWTLEQLPSSYIQGELDSAKIVKHSSLNYTLVKLTWLYNGGEKTDYELIPEGEKFANAEVSREAVAEFIYQLISQDRQKEYNRKSVGIGKPNTAYDKPSFYM